MVKSARFAQWRQDLSLASYSLESEAVDAPADAGAASPCTADATPRHHSRGIQGRARTPVDCEAINDGSKSSRRRSRGCARPLRSPAAGTASLSSPTAGQQAWQQAQRQMVDAFEARILQCLQCRCLAGARHPGDQQISTRRPHPSAGRGTDRPLIEVGGCVQAVIHASRHYSCRCDPGDEANFGSRRAFERGELKSRHRHTPRISSSSRRHPLELVRGTEIDHGDERCLRLRARQRTIPRPRTSIKPAAIAGDDAADQPLLRSRQV